MNTIHKHVLGITDEQTITTHRDYIVRHVAEQDGNLCMWVEVDPQKPRESVNIQIYGTGRPIFDDVALGFLGTAQVGQYVWHVYQEI